MAVISNYPGSVTEKNIEKILLKVRGVAAIAAVSLCAVIYCSCSSKPSRGPMAAPAPTISPTPKPKPLVAYLREGNLWAVESDGTNGRVLALAREGDAVQDFVWSPDGRSLYFSIGLQFFEIMAQTGNVANAGELSAPRGVSVDYLEMSRDGKVIIVHALDANASSRLYALTVGGNGSRELTIDDYNSLIRFRPPVVKSIGELSVSPDGRRILFKKPVGLGEELFVSDIETGSQIQITNLYELGGFEESIETEGGRRVIEAAWSPDGRYVIFNPMQSCSETGLCYGRLYLVEAWGGPQLQLSVEMMVNVPFEWSSDGALLVYDDGSKVVVTDTFGSPKSLGEGNRPKSQPMPH